MIHRMKRRGARQIRARRGSVSVEFALVTVFFLFPLVAGTTDMLLVLSARAKLNSTLHTLYMFAWSNPGSAGDITQLQQVIQSVDPALPTSSIILNSSPMVQGVCFNASGLIDPYAVFTPASPGVTGSTNTCTLFGITDPYDVAVVIASYSLTSTVQLPVPVPFLPSSFTLTASGTVQVE